MITYEQMLQSSSNGMIATDSRGLIVFLNQKAEQVLGFESHRVWGTYICDILPMTGPQVMKCIETGEPQLGHHIIGKNISLVLNITIIKKSNRIQGAICCFQGMDEFESAAKKLESYRLQNVQLKAIFQSSSDGIWICDPKGKIIDMNPASEAMNGIRAEDRVGRNVMDLIREGYIDRSATMEAIAQKKQVSISQFINKTRRHLLVTATPVFDDGGKLSLVVLNERDLTQLNQLKEQLEETRRVTEKYKDELAELSMLRMRDEYDIITKSERFNETIRTTLKIARMDASNILLQGESGTGKGHLARFIHKSSPRNEKPLIQINCAALPENLLEAELFGYERGAFTGASERGKAGLIELAHEGALFLDEIAELPFGVQAKLLKYLDDHEVMRLGSTQAKKTDCMIIAATNRDLESLVKAKKFRQDLYYRLSTFTISIPSLRERREDMIELIHHFLEKFNAAYRQKKRFSPEAFRLLFHHPFPGNIRELKNVIERAVVMSDSDLIDEGYLRSQERSDVSLFRRTAASDGKLNEEMVVLEKGIFERAMASCRSTREMARHLKISQPTVVRKMKKFALSWDAGPRTG
jgi:PAS domain S-box-containing protein